MNFFCIILLTFILFDLNTYAQSVELNSSNYQVSEEKVINNNDNNYDVLVKCQSGNKVFEGTGTSPDYSAARKLALLNCRTKVVKAVQESGGSQLSRPVENRKVEDDKASKEMDRIRKANLNLRQEESDGFKKNHPNYASSKEYVAFKIKQENDTFNSDLEMYQDLCQRFNSYCDSVERIKERERSRDYNIEVHKLNYQSADKVNSGKMKETESDRLRDLIYLQFLSNECSEFKHLCDVLDKEKGEYKTKYSREYDSNEIVKVEEMSLNENKKEETVKDNTPTYNGRNYKPDSCVWAEDLPRRIVEGPGCNKAGNRLCVGFVVCEQKVGGAKFVRMSTCSSEHCVDGGAVACTKQMGYGSRRPEDVTKATVSDPIKDILSNKSNRK